MPAGIIRASKSDQIVRISPIPGTDRSTVAVRTKDGKVRTTIVKSSAIDQAKVKGQPIEVAASP